MNRTRHNKGLTLVEILVVLGIILALVAVMFPVYSRLDAQSKERGVRAMFQVIESALDEYHEVTGVFPVPAGGTSVDDRNRYLVQELTSRAESRAILDQLDRRHLLGAAQGGVMIRDPWGRVIDYQYNSTWTYPLLLCAGPDGKFDTGDDLRNR